MINKTLTSNDLCHDNAKNDGVELSIPCIY